MQRLKVLLAAGAVLALASPVILTPVQLSHDASPSDKLEINNVQLESTADKIVTTDISGNSRDNARVKRLTAFGAPAEPAPIPKQGKGRECKKDVDCGPIPHTSCLADHKDGKKRCLCPDYTHPNNGACNVKNRVKRVYIPSGNVRPSGALYEKCDSDTDCLEGGECRKNGNATNTVPRNTKICLCLPSRVEDRGSCNGSEKVANGFNMAIAFSTLALILRFSPN